MNNEQAKGLIGVPIGELAEMCKDPEVLCEVISIAFNKGYQTGHKQGMKLSETANQLGTAIGLEIAKWEN